MSRPTLLATFALVLVLPGSAFAAAQPVLGPDGVVYQTVAGSYGELFPDGTTTAPENSVLALDLAWTAFGRWRLLVPGTEGPETESSPSAYVEPDSGALYLIWESTVGYLHSHVNLISFSEGVWLAPYEISGNPFSFKTSPSLFVTRDSFVRVEDGIASTHQRKILHVLWWERSGFGDRAVYSPIVLVDGEYEGTNEVVALAELDGSPSFDVLAQGSEDSFLAPALSAGEDSQSVIATLVDRDASRLVTFRLEALPGELSQLAEEAGRFIEEQTRGACEPGGLADRARAHILVTGAAFRVRDGALAFVADAVSRLIASAPAPCDSDLGAAVRVEVGEAAAELLHSAIIDFRESARAHILPVGNRRGTRFRQHVAIRSVSKLPVPDIGPGVNVVYASPDGAQMLVAWQSGPELHYRESHSGAWGQVHVLELGSDLTLEMAHAILRQRMGSR